MSNIEIPYYPEGFFAGNLEELQNKLGTIAMDGPDHLSVCVDFDRTMTTNGPKDLTSWDVLGDLLPPEARDEDRRLWNMFQPLEYQHLLTRAQAVEWWDSTLQLYADSKIGIDEVKNAADSIQLRPGTIEFFETCRAAGVHTTILSAGIRKVIETVTENKNISPNLILATKLRTDERGKVVGWYEDTVVHILNKGEKGSGQLADVRRQRRNTLLVGDAIEDTDMVEGDERVIRVRMGDPHKINVGRATEYLNESWAAGYDLVCLGDFYPIKRLASWLIHAADPDYLKKLG